MFFHEFLLNNYFLNDSSSNFNEVVMSKNLIDSSKKVEQTIDKNKLSFKDNNSGISAFSEKKMAYEIYNKLLSEEKRNLTKREKDFLLELAQNQARMIVLDVEMKDLSRRNTELLDKNLKLGNNIHDLLIEREELLKVNR